MQILFLFFIGLNIFPLFALNKQEFHCPPESYLVDFQSTVSKANLLWCQKKVGDSFVKVGPEYVVLDSGELSLVQDHGGMPASSMPVVQNQATPTNALSGNYSGTFQGECKKKAVEGTFNAFINEGGEIKGDFVAPKAFIPLKGPILGKIDTLGVIDASGTSIFDCHWSGKLEGGKIAKGTWECELQKIKMCSGDWAGAKD